MLKNQAKKGVFRHFLENVDQKLRFFLARAPPSKLPRASPAKAPLEKF